MRIYGYENYIGEGEFVYIAGNSNDADFINMSEKMASEHINLICDCIGRENSSDMARAIHSANVCIFCISDDSQKLLEFRNKVNYAINAGKTIICIRLDKAALTHGLDMQLANYDILDYENVDQIFEILRSREVITQNVLGEMPKRRNINRTRQLIFTGIIIIAVAVFFIAAFKIIKDRKAYYASAEFQLSNTDGQEYVDASAFGEDAIRALEGKTIGELNLSDAGITDLKGIEKIDLRCIDLSGNPDIYDYYPLLGCPNIECIKVSQDALKYVYILRHNVEIVITR